MSLFRKKRGPNPRGEARAPQPVAPPPPPPQFLRDTDVRTSLGPDAIINGRLSFTTPTRIEGRLKGELRCTHLLVVGVTAVVEGMVKVEELRVEGTVRGEIIEARRIEIGPSGKLYGRLVTESVILHEGGIFEGSCRMGSAEEQAAGNSNQ